IVAMKNEKIDMFLNIFSFLIYLIGCFVGLSYFKSLTAINYSIFASFIIFHISQNIFLVKKGMASIKSVLLFYLLILIFALSYHYMADQYNSILIFILFTFLSLLVLVAILLFQRKNQFLLLNDLRNINNV